VSVLPRPPSSLPARDLQHGRRDEEDRLFDQAARNVDGHRLGIDPLVLERYARPALRRRFNKEFRFRTLGNLAGKTVLDVGCGDGLNAVLLAKRGARVTGLDDSPAATERARRRARVNGVSERTVFVCAPVETADLPADSFDIVWGDEFLHRVLDDLEPVLRRLVSWTKPSGLLLFAEPVNLANALRRVRSAIPLHRLATSTGRPLVRRELDLLRRYVPDVRVRHYCLFGRAVPFILAKSNYERSSLSRRAIVNAIDLVDYVLLSLPLVKRLGGAGVIYGHPRQAPDAAFG
jgi:2-polyprenyl-3-methyl-5-hydroxy-6-metoxy-1,4-benzoquinol methylase